MLIEDRLRECSDNLAMALNPVDDEEFDLDGQKINLHQFIPIVFKHLNRVILKQPDKAEEIFLFLVDAIHYSMGLTDEPPKVTYYSNPLEADNYLSQGHKEPKVKVKTK